MPTCTSIRSRADHLITRKPLALSLSLTLVGCASLETGADHARDFAERHPVVTAVGVAVVVGGAIAAAPRVSVGSAFLWAHADAVACRAAETDQATAEMLALPGKKGTGVGRVDPDGVRFFRERYCVTRHGQPVL